MQKNSKPKIIILSVAILLCLAACFFVLATDFWGMNINIIKHHEMQLEGFTLKLYGDLNDVRCIKVFEGKIRRATADISVDTSLLDQANSFIPYLDDLNGDGHLDMLVPHSKDADSQTRYAALIWDNSIEMFYKAEALSDIANIKTDPQNGTLKSSLSTYTVVIPEQPNAPEIYEERRSLTEYRIIDSEYIPFREVALTYYSDTNMYCYSTYDYNEETKELTYTDEQWLTPKKAEEIVLS